MVLQSLAVTWLVAMQSHNSCTVDDDNCEQRLLPLAEAKMQHIKSNLEMMFGSDISQDLQRFWSVATDKQTLHRLYKNRQHEDVRRFMSAVTDCLSVRLPHDMIAAEAT
jgi:RPA family protein